MDVTVTELDSVRGLPVHVMAAGVCNATERRPGSRAKARVKEPGKGGKGREGETGTDRPDGRRRRRDGGGN